MKRESKNKITGQSRFAVLSVTSGVFVLLVSLLIILILWSYHSVVISGKLDAESDGMKLTYWLIYAMTTPLCNIRAALPFIASRWLMVVIIDIVLLLLLLLNYYRSGNYREIEHGSSRWAAGRDLKPFRKAGKNMPLGENVYLTPKIRPANNNIFVLSSPGGGKTFSVIIPAIEAHTRAGGSFVCTDTKGALYRDTAKLVRERGVHVYLLNLSDPWYSHRYNPLYNIHPERADTEIAALALAYTKNVRNEEAGVGDAIWEDTFKQLMICVWQYQYSFPVNPLTGEEETRALWRSAELVRSLRVGEDGGIDYSCELSRIVAEVRTTDPLHTCVACYDFISSGAAETVASVIFTAGSKISMFLYPEIECMTRCNDINIDKIIEEQSGVYLNFEVGSPYKAIASLFLEQIFSAAYYLAERKYSGRLKNGLKLLLDELPNLCRVHSLPERLSTCRSYNIDCVIAVQSMQQLKKMFKDAEQTLMNNCVTHIYLGTSEPDALKAISEALGKTTTNEVSRQRNTSVSSPSSSSDSDKTLGRELALPSEIRSADGKYEIVLIQGKPPIYCRKFRTQKRKWYKLLGGRGNPDNSCVIQNDLRATYTVNRYEYYNERDGRTQAALNA